VSTRCRLRARAPGVGGAGCSRGGEAEAACRVLRRNERGAAAAAPARIYWRVFLAANDEDMIGFFPFAGAETEGPEGRGALPPDACALKFSGSSQAAFAVCSCSDADAD
jgi:hypothetical protein